MAAFIPFLAALLATGACAYHRTRLTTWAGVTALAIVAGGALALAPVATGLTLVLWALLAFPLLHRPTRQRYVSAPILKAFARMTPALSATEQMALEAGTMGFEGELFSGAPRWEVLMAQPAPRLSVEEQAFLHGPVAQLCAMTDDWQITHELADLPPATWDFLKAQRFFGMIIPKAYGGLGFSAVAHSAVLQTLAGVSQTLASTVAVPNSLGPAELLLHYGTDEQKQHYLPRLADGREIPCFALTGPQAGSDATSIPDVGVVCRQRVNGVDTLGVTLTFDKRYITLAPMATLVGVAFRLYDPDHLMGESVDRGITLALVPRQTDGLVIGRRHFPLNIPFQNGPIQAQGMFVPITTLIGGPAMAGQGWRMLVECLSVGRAISLPSSATGAARMAVAATGAYARLRHQFGVPISQFEGVGEALARMGGLTYATSALSLSTAAAVDREEKPAVTSAIAKYHATEWARTIAGDAMDVHGGKGIILGPRNYLGRSWQSVPIAITVEGANIMTRSLMIFGQGAIRCHPYVLKEMQSLAILNPLERLTTFDRLLVAHLGFGLSNAVRSLVMGLSGGSMGPVAGDRGVHAHYHQLNRYSAALALCADVAMGVLGGTLKVRESLSARLGDALSYLYIGSAMLKRFEDDGSPETDRPLLDWAMAHVLARLTVALDGVIRNFPVRPLAWVLRALVFPWGHRVREPHDALGQRVAALITQPSDARDRLLRWTYLVPSERHEVGQMNAALPLIIQAEGLEQTVARARKAGQLTGYDRVAHLGQAQALGLISAADVQVIQQARALVAHFVAVDDFDPAQLRAGPVAEGRPVRPDSAA